MEALKTDTGLPTGWPLMAKDTAGIPSEPTTASCWRGTRMRTEGEFVPVGSMKVALNCPSKYPHPFCGHWTVMVWAIAWMEIDETRNKMANRDNRLIATSMFPGRSRTNLSSDLDEE